MKVNQFRRRMPTFVVAASALALVLTGCSNSAGSAKSTDSGEGEVASIGKIAAVIKGLDNPFFQHMESGIIDSAEALGVDVEIQAAQDITDTTGQADRLSALANQDYACFVVNPISGNNLVQGIAQIAASGVPIVNIDNPVEAEAAEAAGAELATYIGTDNVAAGELVAQELAGLLPDGGKVAAVGGIAGDVTSGQRIEGFENGLAAGGFELVQTVSANWDRQEALTQAAAILQANSDLVAFFVANDDMAMGVSRAVQDAGLRETVKVVSVDGIDGVASGDIDLAVAQYPYVVGKMGLDACAAAAAGHELPSAVETPIALITSDNAQQAQDAFPEPPTSYDNPFLELLKK
ncbi:substrate-binding domain-containing protein [Microbacterium sp. YY-01]|uniref:substrate-binding domain-containing protein n=1 Tax=Microbacterium sp. YY-01 TaxID=3421634 RepID=UPI003D183E0F